MSEKITNLFSSSTNSKTYIIAEIGVNHNGSLDEAMNLVWAASKARVDAVKFQKRNLEKIYSKKILEDPNSAEWNFDYLIPLLKELELSEDSYYLIKEECVKLGLDLIVTPFDEYSANFVAKLGVAAFKIASADMTNYDLITECAKYSTPLIISTGMWEERDIQRCVKYYKSINLNFALLLANSTYPSPYESLNLRFLERLKDYANVIGYSGHERGTFIPVAAVALGASIVEKHITFDRGQEGPDHKASMLPEEFSEMVNNIRSLELALGTNKEVNQAEKLAKEAFAKSAVAKYPLERGHTLRRVDIKFRSPGKGIFPHEIEDFFGKQLQRDVPEDKYISKDDFEKELLIKNWDIPKYDKFWGVKCRFHDFEEYSAAKSPVIEFHCSDTDLEVDFTGESFTSQLIVHAPEIVNRQLVDICSENEAIVDMSIGLIQKTINKTIQISKNFPLAKPKMVVHLGGMSLNQVVQNDYDSLNERMIDNAIKNFKKLDYNPSDIEILPENLPPRPWYLGGQWHQYGFMPAQDMTNFCEHFNLGMTFDMCHAGLYCNYSGIDLADYTKEIQHLIRHMHISDAKGIDGEGVQIDEGDLNFDNVMSIIKDIDCSWVTEIWSGHLHNGAGVYKSMHRLGRYKGSL